MNHTPDVGRCLCVRRVCGRHLLRRTQPINSRKCRELLYSRIAKAVTHELCRALYYECTPMCRRRVREAEDLVEFDRQQEIYRITRPCGDCGVLGVDAVTLQEPDTKTGYLCANCGKKCPSCDDYMSIGITGCCASCSRMWDKWNNRWANLRQSAFSTCSWPRFQAVLNLSIVEAPAVVSYSRASAQAVRCVSHVETQTILVFPSSFVPQGR